MTSPSPRRRDRAGPRPAVVLVAEDEFLVRMSIAQDLAESGYTVIEAATAHEALAVLDSGRRVDLVFSDVNMPGPLDGIGLLRAIRRRFPPIPVILTSGRVVPSPDELGAGLLFIPKPYRATTVLDLVAREIGRRADRVAAGAA